MTDAINNHGRLKAPAQGSSPASRPAGSRVTDTSRNDGGKAASDVLNLSSERIMEQMARLPEVDQGRVEAIKKAIANGEYQPDPEVIARKFAEVEKLLP
jgi:flagellar biosynthesis anti-sigma factor FlgM